MIKSIIRLIIIRTIFKIPISIVLVLIASYYFLYVKDIFAQEVLETEQAITIDIPTKDVSNEIQKLSTDQIAYFDLEGTYKQIKPDIARTNKIVNVYDSPQGQGYQIGTIDIKTGAIYYEGFGPLAKEYTYEVETSKYTLTISSSTPSI